jgi:hypothetical protein
MLGKGISVTLLVWNAFQKNNCSLEHIFSINGASGNISITWQSQWVYKQNSKAVFWQHTADPGLDSNIHDYEPDPTGTALYDHSEWGMEQSQVYFFIPSSERAFNFQYSLDHYPPSHQVNKSNMAAPYLQLCNWKLSTQNVRDFWLQCIYCARPISSSITMAMWRFFCSESRY